MKERLQLFLFHQTLLCQDSRGPVEHRVAGFSASLLLFWRPKEPLAGNTPLKSLNTMPSPLHPKSIQTTSLFGTTLLLSFLVVGLPHIMPCPVDRQQYAQGRMEGLDADGRRRRRRRVGTEETEGVEEAEKRDDNDDETVEQRRGRECPVPKPVGLIGQVLGFKQEKRPERPGVRIRSNEGDGRRT